MTSSEDGPLAGIRILDLTTFLSGPFGTQILGDLGARVIKVEQPPYGDASRAIPPHYVDGDSVYYLSSNRNKLSIAIDLKLPEGLEVVTRLIQLSDVVIENFRPGVCKRLGLDSDELREQNPSLIWASISGFGQTGVFRDRPAYDMIVQAMSGVMSLTGEPDGAPVRLGVPAGDLMGGAYAVMGILACLVRRSVSGKGETIDISMLDGQLAMLSYQGAYTLNGGINPGPQGSRHDSIPTYRSFSGSDGRQFVVTANTEKMWKNLCKVLQVEELIEDERFNDNATRLKNSAELWRILERAVGRMSAEFWVENLIQNDVPAALVESVEEALQDALMNDRQMVLELESENGHRVRVIGNPIRLKDGSMSHNNYPPRLSEDSATILRDFLNLESEDIEHLFSSGVVMPPENWRTSDNSFNA